MESLKISSKRRNKSRRDGMGCFVWWPFIIHWINIFDRFWLPM